MAKFSRDAEKNTYSWVYTGGCFRDNQAVWYEALAPYYSEKFLQIKFQVRLDHRDFDEISDALDAENAAYSEDLGGDFFDDETIDVQYEKGKNVTESPGTRISRERQAIYDQASTGQITTEGYYIFYNFFNFVGSICMVLAIICLGYLVYLIVTLNTSRAPDEEQTRMLQR